jgi:hypothetical protein
MADYFEAEVARPLLQAPLAMGHLVLGVAVDFARRRGFGDLTVGARNLQPGCRASTTCPRCAQPHLRESVD